MKKSGYNFNKVVSLGYVIEAKPYGINETQKKIQEQGGVVVVLKVGLGYVPLNLSEFQDDVKISSPLLCILQQRRLLKVMRRMSRINQNLLCLTDCNLPLCEDALLCSTEQEMAKSQSLLLSGG